MKKHCIFLILFISFLYLSCGCGISKEESGEESAQAAKETSARSMEATEEEEEVAAYDPDASLSTDSYSVSEQEIPEVQSAQAITETTENISGIFEGLEDNHTAIFSFDGVEYPFYFEEADVQMILYGAILGSSYRISYRYDDTLHLNVIYEISE